LGGEPLVPDEGVLLDGAEPLADEFDELPPPPQPASIAQTKRSRVGMRKANFMAGGRRRELRGD
jgi:hypothetical protein